VETLVNSIAPAWSTPYPGHNSQRDGGLLVSRIPVGRTGKVEELRASALLGFTEASFTTGSATTFPGAGDILIKSLWIFGTKDREVIRYSDSAEKLVMRANRRMEAVASGGTFSEFEVTKIGHTSSIASRDRALHYLVHRSQLQVYAKETGSKIPDTPSCSRRARVLTEPGDRFRFQYLKSEEVDFECELAWLSQGMQECFSRAGLSFVLDTCANDVSARDWQIREVARNGAGETFDTFAPLGRASSRKEDIPIARFADTNHSQW